MRTVAEPSLDARQLYEQVSDQRRATATRHRLAAAQNAIYASYASYENAPGNLAILTPARTDPATRDDLAGNYRYLLRSAKQVRASIFQANKGGRCPLCGQGQASTLDHYLPTEAFPEFSIFPLNLVPACYDCNQRKGTRYADEGAAIFLHAYLDEVPTDEQFLFADVSVCDGNPLVTFSVSPPASMRNDLAQRIQSHFNELALGAYYMVEAINEISERSGVLKQLIDSGATGDDVRDYLQVEAASVAQDKGVNFWRYALLHGMAVCDDLCNGTWTDDGY